MALRPGTEHRHEVRHARHRALLYDDPCRLVEAVTRFVLDGHRRGDRVLVALVEEKLAWVREALGDQAPATELADATAMYGRNGPMLNALLQGLAGHATPGRGYMRVVAEQALATRTPAETRAYMRYEAAANIAYRPFAASVLCPYDTTSLPDAVLQHALETHPELLDSDGTRASPAFVDPHDFVRRHSRVEPPPPGAAELALDTLDDLAPIRHRIAELAERAGLPQARIEEFKIAVNELAANAMVHGAAPRRVWVYTADGAFVCHVQDSGRGLADPLAGYLLPDVAGSGGRGLWLAHQLCDTVEAATDHTATHVSARMML